MNSRRKKIPLWIPPFFLLVTPLPAQAVFTGNNHYERANLNTEPLLDNEHFTDVLSYEPFWATPPGRDEPRGFARTTEGSIDSNRFFIHREVRVRGDISPGNFWGYRLEQREDLEQTAFYQTFDAQLKLWGPFSFRIFGEPAGKKQNSDIGFGGVIAQSSWSVRLEGTLVDFQFNKKNLDQQQDERSIYNLLLHGRAAGKDRGLEGILEWESPVERTFLSEGTRFGHKRVHAQMRARQRGWSLQFVWSNERRFVSSLASDQPLQGFKKKVFSQGASWTNPWVRVGWILQSRRVSYIATPVPADEIRRRWEANPFAELKIRYGKRWTFKPLFIAAGVWRRAASPYFTTLSDFSFQAKLATVAQIDFTPDVGLIVNPTWDLDEMFTGRSFDGGNVQFRARIP